MIGAMHSWKGFPVLISIANFHEVEVQNCAIWSIFCGRDLAKRTNQSKKATTSTSSPRPTKMKAHLMEANPSMMASTLLGCQLVSSCWTSLLSEITKVLPERSFLESGLISPDGRKVRSSKSSPSFTGVYNFEVSCSQWSRARTSSAPRTSCTGKVLLRPSICCRS